MEAEKCFCDLYRDCVQNPDRNVSVGHNQITDTEVFISGAEFVERAGEVCPGTRVYLAGTALNSENVILTDETVTLPREAVTLQCEYLQAMYPGM